MVVTMTMLLSFSITGDGDEDDGYEDQGCISCGILVSGIGARGVSSEDMENMAPT